MIGATSHALGAEAVNRRWLVAGAACLLSVLYLAPLAIDIPLLDPDEGLHAAISQEMVERGDWLIPTFQGQPFADKPPLFFWAQAASLKLFGMHAWAVRLPGLLFAILGVLSTGVVAARLFDRATGWVAGFFQATTILPLALAQAAVHDVALIPFTNLAILALYESISAPRVRAQLGWITVAGGLLGLACLTKGLMGLACAGLVIGLFLALGPKRKWPHIGTLIVACAAAMLIAAPWYLLMERRSPGYLHYYFIERHFWGYLTSTQRHGDARWWYYLPILLGGGLPWISYLPTLWIDRWKGGRREVSDRSANPDRLLWIWLLAWTAFVCAGQSKLVTYLLPAFPAIAILAASAWVRFSRGELHPAASRFLTTNFRFTTLAAPFLLPFVWLGVWQRFPIDPSWQTIAATCALGASPWLIQFRGAVPNLGYTLGRAGLVVALVFLSILATIVPELAQFRSARNLAERVNADGLPTQLLLAQDRIGSFVFYLTPERRREIRPGGVVGWPVRQWGNDQSICAAAVLALPETMAENAIRQYSLRDMPFEQAGGYRLYDAVKVRARVAEIERATLR